MSVYSIFTKDCEKELRKMGRNSNKFTKKINELIDMENHPSKIPSGVRFAESYFGKRLEVNKSIYSLEVGSERALAYLKEEGDCKIYVWFFAGSHQDYNKKIKPQSILGNKSGVLSGDHVLGQIEKIKEKMRLEGNRVVRSKSSYDS